MAITATHKDVTFGIGDRVKVNLRIKEGDKERTQAFEGMVIAIKNRGENRTFTVRRIGSQNIGIERIFPISSPFLENISVLKEGTSGVRRAKLYYTRGKSSRELDTIYSRAIQRTENKKANASKK